MKKIKEVCICDLCGKEIENNDYDNFYTEDFTYMVCKRVVCQRKMKNYKDEIRPYIERTTNTHKEWKKSMAEYSQARIMLEKKYKLQKKYQKIMKELEETKYE